MDRSASIRAKFKFRDQIKVARLDGTVDKSFTSFTNLRTLIFKCFPEIEEMVEPKSSLITWTRRGPSASHRLHVSCEDSTGDFVTLDNDADLEEAMENKTKDINFLVDVTQTPSISVTPSYAARRAGAELEKSASGSSREDRTFSSDSSVKQQKSQHQLCRYFERGNCRNGPTCRFSHNIEKISEEGSSQSTGNSRDRYRRNASTVEFRSRSSDPFTFRRTIDSWLANQFRLGAAENIEQLSSAKGLDMLSKVVQQPNLLDDPISQLVKVLVKEEVKSSLLRNQTNKIYGVLLGSPFLLQLHAHVASYLGIGKFWTPKDVEPYLLLIEELQTRTEHGWKEVPLDAMHSIVIRLNEGLAKDALVATVTRLIDQRDKLQRMLAISPVDRCLQGAQFRQMSIVAGREELVRFQARDDLPINRIGRRYARLDDYLETHFRLLREDCIDPLRQGIKAYRSNKELSRTTLELRIYSDVKYVGVRCGDKGIEYVVSFHIAGSKHGPHDHPWESSKRLMSGALLCISLDEFETFVWGVVARRDLKELARGHIAIRLMGESEDLNHGKAYVMVESTAAYFEAYVHVLKSLQREEMEQIPFCQYLLHLEPRASPPSYLQMRGRGDEYDFLCAFPDILKRLGRSSFRINQEWPTELAETLDKAQQNALKQGLTKELAIIQGPPGTGKTFLGLLLVKILLANLQRSPDHDQQTRHRVDRDIVVENDFDLRGPILVICYTNHALDQFLEGIYKDGETNLIRIGGNGKSDLLKGCNLQTLLQLQRSEQAVDGSHRRLFGQGRSVKDSLESRIYDCIDVMGLKLVTCGLLHGVATQEQSESLFSRYEMSDSSSKHIVQLWLTEGWCVDPYLAHHYFLNRSWSPHEESVLAEGSPDQKPQRGRMKLLPPSEDKDESWTVVTGRRRGRGRGLPRAANQDGHRVQLTAVAEEEEIFGDHENMEDGVLEVPLHHFIDVANVWQLTITERRMLHDYWLDEIRMNCRKKLRDLSKEYEEACKNLIQVENEIQLSLLRKSRVIGMTTTAAAKYHDVVKSLKPEIVIVEEAAEVLEGHILACLSPSVKHLILIGDHQQLRPSVAVHRLATDHKLEVSMFERLVRSGVEHVTLQEQRRMRPEIAKLVKSLYPQSKDHFSISQYESVLGVSSNVFFFNHKAEETQSRDAASKVNPIEAKLVVELCLYLLNQGCYEAKQISILSMYTGQLQEIKTILKQRSSSRLSVRSIGQTEEDPDAVESDLLPRVSSVDDYQGEESDIIILSLVRSNAIVTDEGEGKIGFLKTPNRICVALTRAKKGLYIFGNADLLAQKSSLWGQVTDILRDDGALASELELYCQNHPKTKTMISKAEDFKQVEDGGCSLACEYQLDCGHVCPRRCHPGLHNLVPGLHNLVICPKPCLRRYKVCVHICKIRCHGDTDCSPCDVIVTKQLQSCAHEQEMKCFKDVKGELCRSVCTKSLECGHPCRELCGRPCTELCETKVERLLPCGHSASIACHIDPESYFCREPCGVLLPGCNHSCAGSCGKCIRGTEHIPCVKKCGRSLPCGHLCEAGCSIACPPCQQKCRKRCIHSVCKLPCGEPCIPCVEPCAWYCKHSKCEKLCHEVCGRPRCDHPCPKLIRKCGHRCIGLCGESCP